MLKHIAVGISIGYLFFLFVWAKQRFPWRPKNIAMLPYFLLICCIWSIIPTIINKLGIPLLEKVMNNFFVSNIFFFHGMLKRVPTGGVVWGLGILFAVFFSLMGIFTYCLWLQERRIRELRKEVNR